MEICEKGEVADISKDGKIFSEEETKSIMKQLGSAVSYLHKHGSFLQKYLNFNSCTLFFMLNGNAITT